MSVTLVFACDGCDAKTEGTKRLRKEFVSISGRNYGIGAPRWQESPEDVAPEGWIAADPYTYCTYCPKCWTEIDHGQPSHVPPNALRFVAKAASPAAEDET